MEIILVLVLGLALIVVWKNSRDETDRLGQELFRLRNQLEFLQAQVASLLKATSPAPSAPVTSAETATAQQLPPSEPATPTFENPPVEPVLSAAPEPHQAVPEPQVIPEPVPATWFEVAQARAADRESATQPPSVAADQTPTPSRPFSFEETLGANWLNKLGIAILVIGLAFFLAVKMQTWGPAGKVFCGFLVSGALLGGGVWLERKPTYRLFARGGIGGGWALAFFTTFAMYHLPAAKVLGSLPLDLTLMLLAAGGMVAHSLRYRSQTVTSLAFLLGFATLLTSHMEQPEQTVLFSLAASAILAIGLVVVTTIRHWAILELCGLAAVYLSHLVWLSEVLPQDHQAFPQFWQSTALILLYWLIFRLAYVLRTPLDDREENLSSISAIVNSAGVLGLLKFQSAHPEWAFWTLVVLGSLEMALAYWAKPKRRQAFVVLSTVASVLLIASVPFRFHGVSWAVLWLVEAHVLAVCGLRLGEPIFRRLGLLAGLVTGGVLAFDDVLPLFASPDLLRSSHHWSLTVALSLAALLYWVHAEVYPRRWPAILEHPWEDAALKVTSWLGLGAATTALAVVLPNQWFPTGWMLLAVLLGLAADWKGGVRIALQSDALALAAFIAPFAWLIWQEDWNSRVPLLILTALFYCAMWRKTVPGSTNYVAPAYSWAAAVLMVFLAYNILLPVWVAMILALLCVVLFEVGRFAQLRFFRWQASAVLGVAFLDCGWSLAVTGVAELMGRTPPGSTFSSTESGLLEVLTLAAVGFWLYERTRNTTRAEHVAGVVASSSGILMIAAWFAFRFPSRWVPVPGGEVWVTVVWAAMSTALLGTALVARRPALVAQATAMAVLTALRGLLVDLPTRSPEDFWQTPLFHLLLASLLLFAALAFAFRLRSTAFWEGASLQLPAPFDVALRRPEQWFFFAPFALLILGLAAKLSFGHITIGWSLLGLGAFLFALAVGERSFRLAGLGLLLVSVAKILVMDVWTLAPSERYTTLIVLGLALLAVSYLYTRFSTAIRKFL